MKASPLLNAIGIIKVVVFKGNSIIILFLSHFFIMPIPYFICFTLCPTNKSQLKFLSGSGTGLGVGGVIGGEYDTRKGYKCGKRPRKYILELCLEALYTL